MKELSLNILDIAMNSVKAGVLRTDEKGSIIISVKGKDGYGVTSLGRD